MAGSVLAMSSSSSSSANGRKKKFKCDECSKMFSTRAHLERHLRVHTGEKPFACHICDKRFSQRGNLNVHLRSHSGLRPYACRICKKAFSTSSYRNLHEKGHHPDDIRAAGSPGSSSSGQSGSSGGNKPADQPVMPQLPYAMFPPGMYGGYPGAPMLMPQMPYYCMPPGYMSPAGVPISAMTNPGAAVPSMSSAASQQQPAASLQASFGHPAMPHPSHAGPMASNGMAAFPQPTAMPGSQNGHSATSMSAKDTKQSASNSTGGHARQAHVSWPSSAVYPPFGQYYFPTTGGSGMSSAAFPRAMSMNMGPAPPMQSIANGFAAQAGQSHHVQHTSASMQHRD